jgi:hypothetical protein
VRAARDVRTLRLTHDEVGWSLPLYTGRAGGPSSGSGPRS